MIQSESSRQFKAIFGSFPPFFISTASFTCETAKTFPRILLFSRTFHADVYRVHDVLLFYFEAFAFRAANDLGVREVYVLKKSIINVWTLSSIR